MARRGRRVQEEYSTIDVILAAAAQLEQQSKKPNIIGYEPHDKQKWFHTHTMVSLRLYIGGNRSGKSYGAVAEDIWWASGTHPYREIPKEQIRGRVVAVNFEQGVLEILLPIFKVLCPPSYLKGGSWETAWHEGKKKLYFEYYNSYIEFMSYEQETEKFAGTSRHFVHYDEEPPKNVYTECQARLIDTNGCSWISMTPVEGMTWVFDEIYDPADNAEEKVVDLEGDDLIGPVWHSMLNGVKKIAVVEVGMNENPHLSAQAREEFLSGLDADDRLARSKGKFVQTAGRVFKTFAVETHVTDEDFDPGKAQKLGYQIYTSTDHGWNAPTAWLWHCVRFDGRVVTFAEHYKSEMTIEEHAEVVHAKEKGWGLDRDNIIRTGDPAMNQHNAVTGTTIIQEYAKHGLYIYTDSIPKNPEFGIARMQMYFRLRDVVIEGQRVQQPMWMISNSCPNFIKELKKLRWKKYSSKKAQYENNPSEQVHKKDDHAFDSAKYFATFLDELAPEPPSHHDRPRSATLTYDEGLSASLRNSKSPGIEWEIVESYT